MTKSQLETVLFPSTHLMHRVNKQAKNLTQLKKKPKKTHQSKTHIVEKLVCAKLQQ